MVRVMAQKTVTLAEAKAHLSELTEQAGAGADIIITKRGKPVGRLAPPERPRRPVDVASLRRLTDRMTPQDEPGGEFIRELRDDSRY